MKYLMLSCRAATRLMEKKLTLGNLTFWGNLQLKMHLNVCERCRRYAEQSAAIEIALRRKMEMEEEMEANFQGEPPMFPEGFHQRVLKRLELEHDSGV